MKIALIDPSLFTPPYDHALVGGLRSLGHDVRLYGPAGVGHPEHFGHFYRVTTWPGMERLPKGALRLVKGLSHAAGMASLVGALRRWRPDVIHFQWVPLPVVDRKFLAAFGRIAPLVMTVHDSNPFNGNPSSSLQRLGAMAIWQAFDALIVHTQQAAARLRAHGVPAERLHRVPHGLLHEPASALRPNASSRHERPDERLVLLAFGKLKPYKGIDVLIDALAQLTPAQRAKVVVRVVGSAYMPTDPLLAQAVRRGVDETIEFDFRFVPDDALAALIAQSTALVFPYREIDASGVLMIALAAGKPIIASAIGNFVELLESSEAALLVPPGDAVALAQRIGRFIDEADLRARMRDAALRQREAIPSWAAIAQQTVEVYRALRDHDLKHVAAGGAPIGG